MKVNSTPTFRNTSNDSIMGELAVYGLARTVAKEAGQKSGQSGTPVIGFTESADSFEVTYGDPMELAGYNVDFAIVAPDTEFNLIVRKDNPKALKSLPKDKLREQLGRILDNA